MTKQDTKSRMEREKPKPKTEAQAFRPEEAAIFIGVPHRTLETWRRVTRKTGEQKGPRYIRLSHRHVIYRRVDLLQWLEDQIASAEAA